MRGFIFAAGLGTRLKPLTDTMPKALVPLAGKPLLQWQVEKLRDAGITDIVVNVHHFPDMIIDAVRAHDGWGANIRISDERDQLLDTGGGLRKAWREGLLPASEPLLACNVDILSNINLPELIHTYTSSSLLPCGGRSGEGLPSLLVVSERQTQRYLLFDEQNYLCGWTNIATGEYKPSSLQGEELRSIERPEDGRRTSGGGLRKLAFSGMQILSPEVFEYMDDVALEKGDKFSLIDFYLQIINHQSSIIHLKAYIPDAYKMMDVGKIDQIEEAEAFAERL